VTQSPVFEWLSQRLEVATGWTHLVARGTVRLALKEMGLDPRTVGRREMIAALRSTLGRSLEMRRVASAGALCDRLERDLATANLPAAGDSPEEIFKRLGRT
jgi:hypothetical protein